MRAFVASDDPALSFQLRETLARLGHDCPASQVVSLDAAAARFSTPAEAGAGGSDSGAPDLVLIVLPPDPERGVGVLRDARRGIRGRLFAVGPVTDPKLVLRTLREGAHEYLDQADLSGELAAALDRLQDEQGAQRTRGRVVGLLPASGGCGCTTMSANIAVVLARTAGNCVLLDLNPETGDLASLLDLKPTYTLADLCRSGTRLDRSLLEGSLAAHSSGVKLLPAPVRIADASHVSAEGIRRVVALAADLAPVVVADLARSYRGESFKALGAIGDILLVMRLDFMSLRNARRVLEHLQDSGLSTERVRVVVNRYRQPAELPVADAESALGTKISYFVLDDPKSVNRANNNGVPVVLQSPSAKISGQIADLAASLQPAPAGS